MRGRRLGPLLLAVILLSACAEMLLPEGTVEFEPPARYRVWWEASRACVNRLEWRRYESVRWFLTQEAILGSDGRRHNALVRDGDIYIWVVAAEWPYVIQHELVHVINWMGNEHPDDPFVRCRLLGGLRDSRYDVEP